MKPVKVYSQLALLCLLMMSMGFPSVTAEDDTDSDSHRSKSVRYVKVGFLACTRHVSQAENTKPLEEPKCVNNIDKEDSQSGVANPSKISTQVGTSVEAVSASIRGWLRR